MPPFGYENRDFEKNMHNKPFDKKYKKPIEVDVLFKKSGTMLPLRIFLDRVELEVSKVLSIRKGQSLKTSQGESLRYTVKIQNRQFFLFFDILENRWYIELEEEVIFNDF